MANNTAPTFTVDCQLDPLVWLQWAAMMQHRFFGKIYTSSYPIWNFALHWFCRKQKHTQFNRPHIRANTFHWKFRGKKELHHCAYLYNCSTPDKSCREKHRHPKSLECFSASTESAMQVFSMLQLHTPPTHNPPPLRSTEITSRWWMFSSAVFISTASRLPETYPFWIAFMS